jgi:hypothetical protein
MGWTSYHRPAGETDRAHLQREVFGTRHTILDSATKSFTFYAAVRDNDTGEVFGAVVLQQRRRGYDNYAYKAMSEDVGPGDYDCPTRILDLLSPTTNEYALAWREQCRARAAAKAARPKVKAGDTIRLAQPLSFGDGYEGDTFTLVKGSVFRAVGQVNRYRIPRWRDRAFEVVAAA